jgi:ribulose kinase
MKMNNLTTSIYSQRALEGNGASASSFTQSGVDTAVRLAIINGTGSTASVFASSDIYIPNYAGSNYKSISVDTVMENNDTTSVGNLLAYLVSSTAAITDITFSTESTGGVSFGQYSTFYLYGISNS